ncbi:MAG: YqcC family protein [Planctomycetes bacterium]|jgi:uncharacterized protein YqcC (DUF446 family)|nr:YqcC family protein [Planctomycetota bacterium]
MGDREKLSAETYAGAARRIGAVEAELRRLGRWQAKALPRKAMEFKEPFGADTMSFEQWLQFVLVPRVRQIVAGREAFPPKSETAVYAARYFEGDSQAATLLGLLAELDGFVNRGGEAPPPPPVDDAAVRRALDEYRSGTFVSEVEKIRKFLGRDVGFEVDWDSVLAAGNSPEERLRAIRDLAGRGVSDIRSAILLLRSNHGEEAAQAIAGDLQKIRFACLPPGNPPRAEYTDGVLSVRACLRTDPVRNLKIGHVLADALDLRAGPLVKALESDTIPEHEKRLLDAFEAPIAVEVDVPSFRAEPDDEHRLSALRDCAREGIYYLCYALEQAGREESGRNLVRARVTTLRIRHVTDPAQCELYAEGSTIVFAARFFGDASGRLGASDLEERLPGLLTGMPGPVPAPDTRGPGPLLARALQFSAACQSRISEALGAPAALAVDLGPIAGDAEALALLPRRALSRVTGAILLVAPEIRELAPDAKPRTIRVRFVSEPGARSCGIAAGTLDLAVCPRPVAGATATECGFFYESEIATALADGLGLETTPRIRENEEEVLPDLRRRLREALDTDVSVEADWSGFLTHPDAAKRKYALKRLGQDALDHLYYALSSLAEKSEDLARLIRRRLRAIRIEHVPTAARKALLGVENTLIFRVSLFEGYDGRFIIDDLKKRLPVVFAEMPEIPEAPAPGPPAAGGAAHGRSPADEARIAVLRSLIEAAVLHLEEGRVQSFLLMFLPAEAAAALWKDGGHAFARLTGEYEARRDEVLTTLRRCLSLHPEMTADSRAIFRFAPPDEPLVFHERSSRWLLDLLPDGGA